MIRGSRAGAGRSQSWSASLARTTCATWSLSLLFLPALMESGSAWVLPGHRGPFLEQMDARAERLQKSKRGGRALEEAERYRSTGRLPLAFSASADSPRGDDAEPEPDTPEPAVTGKGRRAPAAGASAAKRHEDDSSEPAPSRPSDASEAAAERRLRVMRHLGLVAPAPA